MSLRERASYSDALERHYVFGAPEDWADSFISEYATMHPWEDFAETFAHYLHITGTLATAAAAGVVLDSDRVDGVIAHDVVPALDYSELGLDRAGRHQARVRASARDCSRLHGVLRRRLLVVRPRR